MSVQIALLRGINIGGWKKVAMADQPAPERVKALQSSITGPELLSAAGRHLYVVYTAGFARSRLTLPIIEKKLGTFGTGRNWNTVEKLAEVASV